MVTVNDMNACCCVCSKYFLHGILCCNFLITISLNFSLRWHCVKDKNGTEYQKALILEKMCFFTFYGERAAHTSLFFKLV